MTCHVSCLSPSLHPSVSPSLARMSPSIGPPIERSYASRVCGSTRGSIHSTNLRRPDAQTSSHRPIARVNPSGLAAFYSGGQRPGKGQSTQVATLKTSFESPDIISRTDGDGEVQGWLENNSERGGGAREDLSGARVATIEEGEDLPIGTRSRSLLPTHAGVLVMRDAILRTSVPEAYEAFRMMVREGVGPSPEDLISLIRLCGQEGAAPAAITVYRAGIESGMLEGMEPGVDRSVIEAMVQKIVNRALQDCGRRGLGGAGEAGEEAVALLEEMEAIGIQVGVKSYRAVIMSWCQDPDTYQKPIRKQMFRMREGGIQPDTRLCNTVIRALGHTKKWWAALEVYEVMRDEGPEPDKVTLGLITAQFELLLDSARKRRLWKWALQLLDRMEGAGITVSGRAWCTCLVTCARAGRTDAAVGIFKLMVEEGRRPGIIEYGALLSALEKGGMLERAVEVWEHMKRMGVPRNGRAYVTMITVYGNGGQYGEAVRVFEEMRKCASCRVDVVGFNAVITACAKSGQGIRALLWMEQMRNESVEADEVTYQQAIEALANEGLWEEATTLYVKGRDVGLKMTQRSYDMVAGVREANGQGHNLSEIGERREGKERG